MLEQGKLNDRQVVVDAGAVIKLQRLERFGGQLFTTSGVLAEVRDENARALLKTLPKEIRIREPLPQDIAYAKQFAKATGDLGFLSHNDLDLIALTVTLHRESGGRLRERPAVLSQGAGPPAGFAPAREDGASPSTSSSCTPAVSPPTALPSQAGGDGADAAEAALDRAPSTTDCPSSRDQEQTVQAKDLPTAPEPDGASGAAQEEAGALVAHAVTVSEPGKTGQGPGVAEDAAKDGGDSLGVVKDDVGKSPEASGATPQNDEEDCESEDGSSAGEWITPENIHRFGMSAEPDDEVKITCATADYSVQNVLLQMGITPLTFDGYAVRSVKLWGLICRACFFFTRDTQKVFCPKCGHDTVVRVPIVVDKDGQPTVLNSGRKLRTKGTVYSIPKPQGGRGWKPIFAEDELLIGGRDRELRRLQKLHEKDRQMKDPFNEDNAARGWWQRGAASNGSSLSGGPRVQAGFGRRNPNANNFKHKGFGQKRR